jgi:FlaA1/EpsC-like NDP-sugar epimerase
MGSRGSVIPFFLERRKTGILPITDERMTRFNISLEEGVDMVLYALEHSLGGEIFVPKIPSYRLTDVAEAIGPKCSKPIVGIRPGEKLHEEMITESDSQNTVQNTHYFVIVPMLYGFDPNSMLENYATHHKAARVSRDFRYSSGTNTEWLTVDQLRDLIRRHVDQSFTV